MKKLRHCHPMYSLYNFYGATMTFKGRLLLAPPMLKLFFFGGEILSTGTVDIGPQNVVSSFSLFLIFAVLLN